MHELDISAPTIVDWYNYAREVCTEILCQNENSVIGGKDIVVEIHESKFGKRKYHKGRKVDGVWVFGGIERDSKKCFFKTVEDRKAETLISIIKEHIKPGTTIISDCWKAYNRLEEEGFKHLTVNHSLNFVDPDTGAHTNTIESTWRALKKSLPTCGTIKTLYDSYFSQYCVRKLYLNDAEDKFLKFISLIKTVYDVDKQKENFVAEQLKQKEPKEPQVKKIKAVLSDITNLNRSLDDFQC